MNTSKLPAISAGLAAAYSPLMCLCRWLVCCAACFSLLTMSAQAQFDLVRLGGATGGYGCDVAVAGSFAYVASYTAGLRVYDISDPYHPALVASTNTGIPYVYDRSVTIAGDYAYTGAIRDTDFHVYDISSPTHPFPVTNVFSGNFVSDIAVTGGIGYVANTAEGFSVYDLANPAMPVRVTHFGGTSATCVVVADGYAYVGGDQLIRVYSLANPAAPVEVGSTNAPSSTRIAVMNGYAFLASGGPLVVFDVTNPAAPRAIGSFGGGVEDVAVSGHYLFTANGSAGVTMYDVANPGQPVEIARTNTTGYAPLSQGLCVSGNYLYVASGNTGFYVCLIKPRLQVHRDSNSQPWISWREPLAPGLLVEESDTLSAKAWLPVNNDATLTNGSWLLKPPASGSRFFRLCISP